MTTSTPPPRGRFAPSPTGPLHLGHARTMLLAWLQMRALGGALVLRIEDVDRARCTREAAAAIPADLAWLGFDWDEGPDAGGPFGPYTQSENLARYAAVLEQLGPRTFRCSCSRKELRAASRGPDPESGEWPYPGTCRGGPAHPERPCSVRLRIEAGEVAWDDQLLGSCAQDPAVVCGDPILWTKDGGPTYQLAVVVDDLDQRVTHVLRGADLVASTARQIVLWRALGAEPPGFAHAPLLRDAAGQRLAKSRGSLGIEDLREAGESPAGVIGGLAAGLGLVAPGTRCLPGELIEAFAGSALGARLLAPR